MPTVTQSAALYVPRHQFIDTNQTGSYRDAYSPSQIVVSSDRPNTSFEQSYSVVKVLDVQNLIEVPTKPKRRLWLIALGIGLCVLLIIAAIIVPVLIIYLTNKSTTTSSTTTTTTSTTSYIPSFCNATCYLTSQAALSSYTAAWTFENNLNDILNIYNGTGVNSPGYSTGYIGQALTLTGAQYVTTPFINFAYSSFTIEAWLNPTTLSNNGPNYTIFGECDITGATRDNCFYGDDLASLSTVSSSVAGTWLHVAFVFDYSLKQQTIYRNGYSDGQATLTGSPAAYIGTSGLVNIGAQQGSSQFTGLIDQIFVSNRAKTACEILQDATLVAYYTFDSGSVQDSGPNYITGTAVSAVITVSGYVNQAISFNSSNAYFYSGGLTALGTPNQAFSFSLWIKLTAYTGSGTIIHVASGPNGYSNGGPAWCVSFIGLDYLNRVIAQVWNGYGVAVIGLVPPLNVWTHIVETYRTTGSTSYSASGVPDYILLGGYGPSGSSCATGSVTPGTFSGAIDEVRIYSRELTLADICVLTNQ